MKDDGLPEHNTGFGNMSDKEAQVQLLITHNNGDTSTNLLSENPDTETAENQNTEITTEESRQQYKVTTGGTRLNIRKEPRADAEILQQKLGDGVVCDATGNKSEDGSWIEKLLFQRVIRLVGQMLSILLKYQWNNPLMLADGK